MWPTPGTGTGHGSYFTAFCYSQCGSRGCTEGTLCLVPFRYLKYTLDQHVENDYTIVYFHYGLSSQNKPSLGWLQNAYKEFDRKYVQSTHKGGLNGRGRGGSTMSMWEKTTESQYICPIAGGRSV